MINKLWEPGGRLIAVSLRSTGYRCKCQKKPKHFYTCPGIDNQGHNGTCNKYPPQLEVMFEVKLVSRWSQTNLLAGAWWFHLWWVTRWRAGASLLLWCLPNMQVHWWCPFNEIQNILSVHRVDSEGVLCSKLLIDYGSLCIIQQTYHLHVNEWSCWRFRAASTSCLLGVTFQYPGQ